MPVIVVANPKGVSARHAGHQPRRLLRVTRRPVMLGDVDRQQSHALAGVAAGGLPRIETWEVAATKSCGSQGHDACRPRPPAGLHGKRSTRS